MSAFREAVDEVLKSGNFDKLNRFLSEALPEDAAKPFLGRWPSFNGFIAQTPIAHRVLTPDVLIGVNQTTLNEILQQALRTACLEGNAKQGIEVLDRLVAAGARMDVMQYCEGRNPAKLSSSLLAEVNLKTGNKPPRSDEQLQTPEAIHDYVDRMILVDAVIYGESISRIGLTHKPGEEPPAPEKPSAILSQLQAQEQTFYKILTLCNITEKMMQEIQAPNVKNQKELLEIVTPVVHAVDNAVKVVTETYIEHINNNMKADKQRSHKVDMAIKEVYDALRAMKEKGEGLSQALSKEAING